jgi:hypothetical protein
MDSAPEFLNLFVDPTGELLYFLAVIAISQAALLMALGQRLRGAAEVAAGRYTVLLAGIVLAWIALMGGALYTLATDTTADAILPPLERAVNLVVIILASAALLAADSEQPVRRSWRATALLCLLAIGAYIYTAATWQPLAAGEDFNEHILGFVWTFVTGLVLISAIGLLLIRYRDTADIPLKLLFFVVLLAGYTYTLILMTRQELDGGASGAIRLSFLASLPMIATVVYRLVLDRLEAAIDEVSEYAEAVSRPLPSQRIPEPAPARPAGASYVTASESMALLKAMGLMLEKEDPESIPRQIAVAVAQVLKADVAVLIAHEDANWADITAAYDHVQGRQVPGLALNLDEQPTLVNALERKSQRPLFPDRNLDELVDLYTRLDISQVGPAYMQPLTRSGQVVGALIVAMPYTGRELDESQTSLLEGLGPIAARLLLLSQAAQRTRFEAEDRAIQAMVEGASTEVDPQAAIAARQEMQESLRLAQQQIGELSHLVRDLQVELDFERSRLAQLVEGGDEALSITQRIESLSQERKQLASEREALVQALHEAQAALATATAEGDEDIFGTMIDTLKRERDELQVQKAKLERQLDEVRAGRETITVPVALREMVTELSEDKARLAVERDQLQVQLEDVQTQLQALGIEGGPLAVAQILGQLTEERTYYKTRAEKIAQERDLLLSERTRLTEQIQREAEREAKIGALEADLRRLATDREALMKQRDSIRAERDDLLKAREAWLDQRTRLLAEVTGLQAELEEAASELNDLVTERKRISQERGALEAQRDRLLAEKTALQTERDQLMARVEGNRELLEQLGADGFGALKVMIDDLTEERQQLEAQLLQTQAQMAELERQATSRVAAASTQATRPIAPENADVILSVDPEIRTPMSSIIG